MRTLLLLRHAKSSWADTALTDHDRPLNTRGTKAAAQIGIRLRSDGVQPALVLCSSARRARDTLQGLRPALDDTTNVQIEDDLYGADADELLGRIRTVSADVPSVMVIGHNPGLENLAIELAGEGEESALEQLHTKYPTGALATLDLRCDWAQLGPGQAFLRGLVLPREQ